MGRWTQEKKRRSATAACWEPAIWPRRLAQAAVKPRVLICASAIGFYGNRGDEILGEESPAGQGFLPEVCHEWENASQIAADAGIRTVNVRIGLVLSPKGGALQKMLTPFKLGLGGRIGSGQQWYSWIHVDDIVGAIHHAMQHGVARWPGESGRAESAAKCRVHQSVSLSAAPPRDFSLCQSLRCVWPSASKPPTKCCSQASEFSPGNLDLPAIGFVFPSYGRRSMIWWANPGSNRPAEVTTRCDPGHG